MRRLSSQDPLVPLVGLLALAAVLAVVLLLLPVRGKAGQQARAAAHLETKVSDAEKLYRSLPSLEKKNSDLREQIAGLSRAVANPAPDVVREIERVTEDLNLRLTSIRPSEAQVEDNCVKYPTVFEVQSSFDKIVKLLYELEQSPHSLWVEGVEINTDQSGGGLRAAVSVAVYTCKPVDGKAADEKSGDKA